MHRPARLALLLSMLSMLAMLWGPLALAGESMFATVAGIRGTVSVQSTPDGPLHPLRAGARILAGERVIASAAGEAMLETADGGIIAVRPGAVFTVARFEAQGRGTDTQVLRLIQGALRIVSGWIARLNPDGDQVLTPSATLSVRGTDHEALVLVRPSADGRWRPGTYDKVNHGAVALNAQRTQLRIDRGRVGFAPLPPDDDASAPADVRSRGLMTLMLPVLLERVPDIFVPGAFDLEIDRRAPENGAASLRLLERTRQSLLDDALACSALSIARHWLERFDQGVAARNAGTLAPLLSPALRASAQVRTADGAWRSIEMDRAALLASASSALGALDAHQQQRLTIEARSIAIEGSPCAEIDIESDLIESGRLDGKPFRLESTERIRLVRDGDDWRAVRMSSTQR